MIQDGWGYGKSSYWTYKAKEIASETWEACQHLFDSSLNVKIDYEPNPKYYNVLMKVNCSKCEKKFPLTEEKLRLKFLEFYGK